LYICNALVDLKRGTWKSLRDYIRYYNLYNIRLKPLNKFPFNFIKQSKNIIYYKMSSIIKTKKKATKGKKRWAKNIDASEIREDIQKAND